MSDILYNVDFSGRIIPGWDMEEVKANVARLLKADEETIYKLFSGQRFVIKKNVDHQTALKINKVLKDAGADCVISPTQNSSATAPPPLPRASEPASPVQAPTLCSTEGGALISARLHSRSGSPIGGDAT